MGESRHSVGVDWASGNWLAVEYRGEEYECVTLAGNFEELWESFDPKPDRILVDVPIGLCDENDDETGERGRECDDFARNALGSRSSSVFTPPTRQAAELARNEEPHETISAKNRDIVGKGLSIQSYHIASGIAEVDAFLDPDEDERNLRRDRVEEAHPEVCFVAFNGGELEYSKTSAVGFGERLSVLENVVDEPGETFRKISHERGCGSFSPTSRSLLPPLKRTESSPVVRIHGNYGISAVTAVVREKMSPTAESALHILLLPLNREGSSQSCH